jgi:hypothetical protein
MSDLSEMTTLPANLLRDISSMSDDPTPTTQPKDQDYWPQDALHDAAKQVVGGIKGLVPSARRTLREAAERVDAAPVGRAPPQLPATGRDNDKPRGRSGRVPWALPTLGAISLKRCRPRTWRRVLPAFESCI